MTERPTGVGKRKDFEHKNSNPVKKLKKEGHPNIAVTDTVHDAVDFDKELELFEASLAEAESELAKDTAAAESAQEPTENSGAESDGELASAAMRQEQALEEDRITKLFEVLKEKRREIKGTSARVKSGAPARHLQRVVRPFGEDSDSDDLL
ncbi:hypothetical protein HDU91_000669 [Kappamyces sp. JEL0680]|nr:hypothetical protein HDU91_000669 [Kappamyces sp. JEL0680]